MKYSQQFFLLGLSIALIAIAVCGASPQDLSVAKSIATIDIFLTPLPSSSLEASTTLNAQGAKKQDIWMQMRENMGYVVLLRHAQTVAGTGDPPGFQLDDCATQRNLSKVGKEQAVVMRTNQQGDLEVVGQIQD